VWIWSADDGKLHRVTDEMSHNTSPAWSLKGDYLYFLSAREYAPLLDGVDTNYAIDRNTGIYALALRKDAGNPFPPESDEVTIEGKEEKDKKDEKPAVTKIDFDGLTERVTRVPVPFDNYSALGAGAGTLVYIK